jgi:hypothetical protein
MRVARLAPVLAVLWTGHAHAAMLAVLSTVTAGSGGNFRYTYTVAVPDDERLDPSATSGISCRGTSMTAAQCDPAGTFFTIYDIVGFVGVETPLPLGWSFSTQSTGITPSTIDGAFDGSGTNVTFTYTGPVIAGPVTVPGFTVLSNVEGLNSSGHMTAQNTQNVGSSAGLSVQGVGSVSVPAQPP